MRFILECCSLKTTTSFSPQPPNLSLLLLMVCIKGLCSLSPASCHHPPFLAIPPDSHENSSQAKITASLLPAPGLGTELPTPRCHHHQSSMSTTPLSSWVQAAWKRGLSTGQEGALYKQIYRPVSVPICTLVKAPSLLGLSRVYRTIIVTRHISLMAFFGPLQIDGAYLILVPAIPEHSWSTHGQSPTSQPVEVPVLPPSV